MKRILIWLIIGLIALALPSLVRADDDISASPPEIDFSSPAAADLNAMAAQLAKTSTTVQQHLDSTAPATSEQGTSEVET